MSDTASDQTPALDGNEPHDANRAALSPGAQLALQRQARGWTIEEVATQLNLASRQIQAIETDNYAALPGMASVRGFIRGYAKILKMDPSPLLAMIASETAGLQEPMPPRRALSKPFSDNRLASTGKSGILSWSVILVIFLVLAVAGAFVSQQMGWIAPLPEFLSTKVDAMTSTSELVQNATVQEAASDAANSNSLADGSQVVAQTPAIVPVPAAPATPAPASTNRITIAEPIVAGIAAPVTPASAMPAAENAAITSRNALVLKLREDSWVQAIRANQTTVLSRLLKAGTTETIAITEPVTLTIGNATGVEVILRGTPIDLKPSTKNNVVRLSLK